MLKKLLYLIILITTNSFSQSPGAIGTGLAYWFKANLGTSTTTDGVAITQWDNNIGTTHAIQAGTLNFPIYKENILNYNPSVYFTSGSQGYFDLNLDAINNTNYNLIAVVQRETSAAYNYFLGTRATTKSEGLHFGYRSDNQITLAQYADDVTQTVKEHDDPSVSRSIIRGQLDSNTNGKTIQELRNARFTSRTKTDLKSFLTGNNAGVLGRGFGDAGFRGYISEIIIYTETLSDSDLAKIYSYLAIKYGMTLDATDGNITNGDYQDSASNVIWDASVNTTYHHDVIGIGKDDDSGLEQVKSVDRDGFLTIDKTSSFSSNLDFVVVGNDDEPLELSSDDVPTSIIRKSQRTWKVQTSGTPGTISVSFELGNGITNSGTPSNYGLIIDSDTDFTTGASIHTTGASIVDNTLTFTGVNFSDGDYFTLGISSVINAPGNVTSNAVSWFKADEGTSTTVDGTVIEKWNNNFGATHANKAGTTDFATYEEDIHNFNPSVYFADGDTGYFDTNLNGINGTDYNVIAIAERDDNVGDSYVIGSTGSVSNEGFHFGYLQNNAIRLGHFDNDLDLSVNNYNDPAVSKSLIRGQLNSATGRVVQELRDGVFSESTDSNTAFLAGGSTSGVLGQGYDSGRGFNGYVSEVIVYNSTLTDPELHKIYSYLAIKYGMTLNTSDGITGGDYQDSEANVIWNETINSIYQNEIIGVGRDDKSILNQLKSIEPNRVSTALTIEKTSSFTNDLDFLLVGNDGGTIGTTSVGTNSSFSERVERTWKTQVTGTPGLVNISFTIGGSITNTGDAFDYALLIDTDTDFSDATIHTNGVSIEGNIVSFTDVNLSDGDIFTLATGSLIKAPGGSVGPALVNWFKADGGTSTTTDGAEITQWDNSNSLSSNHATQAGSSNYPTYKDNIHNFNPSVHIADGDDGYFDVDLSGIENTNYNIIAIVEREATETQNYILGTFGNAKNKALHFGYRSNNTLTLAQYSNDLNVTVNNYDTPSTSIALIRGEVDSDSGQRIQELRDGDFKGRFSASLKNFLTGNNPGVIGKGHSGGTGFNGYVSEILMYNGALTNTGLTKIYSYLAIKYGMTLDASDGITNGDYLDSNENIIWDASDNSDYHDKVIIIGLDDNSDLNQKQSKAESTNAVLTIALGNTVETSNTNNLNTFTDNLDFLAIGSKSTETTFAIECGETVLKVNRDWKVQNTNFNQTVTLEFDMGGITTPEDFDLLIDTDGDFSTTGDQTKTSGNLSGTDLTFTGVTLFDNNVFTLIRKAGYEVVYNGSWSGGSGTGSAPNTTDTSKRVVIESNVTIDENFNCDCLKVNSGQILTVPDTYFVETKELVLNGDLYLEGTSELIQTETSELNSGIGNVYKIIGEATASAYRYNYLSSPVNTSGSFTLSGNLKFNTGSVLGANTDPTFTDDYEGSGTELSRTWMYTLNHETDYISIDENTSLVAGVGFTMKGTNQANSYNFIGTPNNGSITALNIATDDYAIVGNPYPSAIDADTFNSNMLLTNITDGTIYLWDQPNGNNHSQEQSQGGYATINSIGKVSAGIIGATTPTNIIKPGQGFIVSAGTSGGDIVFENSMRISNTSSSTAHLFKTINADEVKPEIRLGFEFKENERINHRQLLVVPNGGSLEHEQGKDALMFDNNKNDAYLLVSGKTERYVITSVPNVDEDIELPVGVVIDSEKEITFKLDAMENVSQSVYLVDKETTTVTNLSNNNSYKTTIDSGDYQDRFSLVFKEAKVLNDDPIEKSQTVIYIENNILTVVLEEGIISEISLHNLLGENVISKSNENSENSINFDISNLTPQIYVVKINTENGVISKKIIID